MRIASFLLLLLLVTDACAANNGKKNQNENNPPRRRGLKGKKKSMEEELKSKSKTINSKSSKNEIESESTSSSKSIKGEKSSKKSKVKKGSPLCATLDGDCGMLPSEAQLAYLHSYEDLVDELYYIAEEYNDYDDINIQVGPLVKNGNNGGLFDIDMLLSETGSCENPNILCNVCGDDTADSVTVRDAVICTVSQDSLPNRGNSDPAAIGYSTQGRELYAARLGSGPVKVVVFTQAHGSEAAGTEAVLNVLPDLARGKGKTNKEILEELDILFITRVNVDGGEPTGENFESNYGLLLAGVVSLDDDKYFWRQNVDLNAGVPDASYPLSEDGFFGVVGRGYDLNRYNFYGLDSPIRPVENQALVAALHVFQPHVTIDMHGDIQKSFCDLDPSTIVPNAILGGLPSVECFPPAPPIPTLYESREFMVEMSLQATHDGISQSGALAESISREIYDDLKDSFVGNVIRFSQIQTGVGIFNNGANIRSPFNAFDTISLGIEVPNFGFSGRLAILGVGEDGFEPGLDLHTIEPCFLADNICLHTLYLEEVLKVLADRSDEIIADDNEVDSDDELAYCDIPVFHGTVGNFPASLGWPTGLAVDNLTQSAGGGQFGIPTGFNGFCPVA